MFIIIIIIIIIILVWIIGEHALKKRDNSFQKKTH